MIVAKNGELFLLVMKFRCVTNKIWNFNIDLVDELLPKNEFYCYDISGLECKIPEDKWDKRRTKSIISTNKKGISFDGNSDITDNKLDQS